MFAPQNRGKLWGVGALIGAVLFLAGILLGSAIADGSPNAPAPLAAAPTPASTITPTPLLSTPAPPDAPASDAVLPASKVGAAVLPDAEVVWRTRFGSCGHICLQEGEDITGFTREALSAQFPELELVTFSAAKVCLEAQRSGYCPAHLVVVLRDGAPAILQTDAQTYVPTEIVRLEWDVSALSASALEELARGVPFDELAQIDEYIENMES